MADDFQDNLQDPENPAIGDEQIIAEIDASNEKDFLTQLKKKNKEFLVKGLSVVERERIAKWIVDRFEDVKGKHSELSDKIDEWDEVWRMVRKEPIGSDGDTPNYRSPLSTVALEVIHANQLNVFFTPKDIMRVIPTEEGDIPKVKKISTFGNWSTKNELDIFNKIDRLFHYSGKTGEAPYMVHWVKEYGTDIKREVVRNPANPSEPLFDPDTQEVLFQEVEEQKLLYNGPRLEVFSRKDYIQPENAMMDETPEWEMRRIRKSFDWYLREELQGNMYAGSISEITDWGSDDPDVDRPDFEGDAIPVGKWNQEFLQFYGRMRVKIIKEDQENDTDDFQELEEEFIAIVHRTSQTLCQLRINKFPLKMRPIGVDYFIPDDEGRRRAMGVMEFLEGQQKSYDALYNQFIYGTVQSNNPVGFFEPLGNMRNEPLKIKNGYMFPTANAQSVNFLKLPPPDASIQIMLELITSWAELLFGISSFSAGVESKIDPDAPAKKAEIVVAQGNVRLNAIIKRKNQTLQDIFKRWFLLYKANMPPNKFMRIVGDSTDNPWKFESITLADFALKSIPDFELTGNVLNANKALEANKALAIYNVLVQNPLFQPQSPQGIQALHSVTKWLIDKLDETGLSRFLPEAPGENVQTPEEENARFLQGDSGQPSEGEDHVNHLKVHRDFLLDPSVPDEVKQELVMPHIQETIKMLQQETTQRIALQQVAGPQGVQQQQAPQQAPQQPQTIPQQGGNGRRF